MKTLLKNVSPFNNKTDMPTWQFVVKKTLAFWLCYIASMFIAEGLVILLLLAMGKNFLVGEMFDAQTMTLITYYGYVVFIAIALLYWKLVEKKPLAEMRLTKRFGSYFFGIAAGILLILLSVGAILLTGKIEYHGVFEDVDVSLLLLFVGGFIIQGGMEEIFCRGFLLHALKEKTSTFVAVLTSSITFILPHCSSLFAGKFIYGAIGIVNLALISVLFSLLTLRFKSVWAACGLHSFWNAVLYGVFGLNLSGNDGAITAVVDLRSVGESVFNGGAYGIEASLITTVVLALAVAMIWYVNKKTNR